MHESFTVIVNPPLFRPEIKPANEFADDHQVNAALDHARLQRREMRKLRRQIHGPKISVRVVPPPQRQQRPTLRLLVHRNFLRVLKAQPNRPFENGVRFVANFFRLLRKRLAAIEIRLPAKRRKPQIEFDVRAFFNRAQHLHRFNRNLRSNTIAFQHGDGICFRHSIQFLLKVAKVAIPNKHRSGRANFL